MVVKVDLDAAMSRRRSVGKVREDVPLASVREKDVALNLRVQPALRQRLKVAAAKRNISVVQLVEDAVEAYLQNGE